MRRKKSVWLHFFVYLIIALLMFSVIGVVVVYLNGIQTQQAQYDAFQLQAQDGANNVINIQPIGGINEGTIVDEDIAPTDEENTVPEDEEIEGEGANTDTLDTEDTNTVVVANDTDTTVVEGDADTTIVVEAEANDE